MDFVQVDLTMTAQPPRPMTPIEGRAGGLKGVRHVIAVSSCKGGRAPGSLTFSYTCSRGKHSLFKHLGAPFSENLL